MKRTRIVLLLLLVVTLIAVGHHQLALLSSRALATNLVPPAYAQSTASPTPTPSPSPTPTPPPILGRMTGGGSLFVTLDDSSTEIRVTKGFQIHCGNPPEAPNNLEVNWPSANNFHLENLTLGVCILLGPPNPPQAPFNEFIGAGTGKLNGIDGASISFVFIDNGEPGNTDTGTLTITDPFGNVVLFVPTTNVDNGNFQAHACTPSCN
jgi:hypothetical protein